VQWFAISCRQNPLPSVTNATIDADSNINATEDNYTIITMWIHDDDVKIPDNQKNFYNETFTINLTIQGPNSNLFSFVKTSDFPTTSFPNRTEYDAIFTPNNSDVGSYNITINITDLSNFSDIITFNLTVFGVDDSPVITNASNLNTSIIEVLYIDFNATDLEDGDESSGNLTYVIANLTAGGNFLNINSTNAPKTGNVAVIQPYTNGNPAGHVQIFDGEQWISDFKQGETPASRAGYNGFGGFWPGPEYRKNKPPFIIYGDLNWE